MRVCVCVCGIKTGNALRRDTPLRDLAPLLPTRAPPPASIPCRTRPLPPLTRDPPPPAMAVGPTPPASDPRSPGAPLPPRPGGILPDRTGRRHRRGAVPPPPALTPPAPPTLPPPPLPNPPPTRDPRLQDATLSPEPGPPAADTPLISAAR